MGLQLKLLWATTLALLDDGIFTLVTAGIFVQREGFLDRLQFEGVCSLGKYATTNFRL